jgi:hypothetical protein
VELAINDLAKDIYRNVLLDKEYIAVFSSVVILGNEEAIEKPIKTYKACKI